MPTSRWRFHPRIVIPHYILMIQLRQSFHFSHNPLLGFLPFRQCDAFNGVITFVDFLAHFEDNAKTTLSKTADCFKIVAESRGETVFRRLWDRSAVARGVGWYGAVYEYDFFLWLFVAAEWAEHYVEGNCCGDGNQEDFFPGRGGCVLKVWWAGLKDTNHQYQIDVITKFSSESSVIWITFVMLLLSSWHFSFSSRISVYK